jgi:hypothetical protein
MPGKDILEGVGSLYRQAYIKRQDISDQIFVFYGDRRVV